ncbi:PepSY domain-containing protein [Thalassotalea maritima]|uniref:PepSY domain-containing protein n=1 Tax=Thalassotalea maritima TaxID=3242416 RepID=UPI003528F6B8
MQWLRKVHKWASLLVGVQLLIWLISGMYFTLMDHHKAGGHQYRAHVQQHPPEVSDNFIDISEIIVKTNPVTSVKLVALLGQPYYLLNHEKGLYPHFTNHYSLYHAKTGNRTHIDADFARELALQSYNGPGEVTSTTLLKHHIEDIPKQQNPSWRVNFSDEVNTSVYIEADTGRIVGHSDDDKRFADIFFMLHFMDYNHQGSFNNWQIMFFAVLMLWLSITGVIWTIDLVRRGHYKLPL